MKNILYAVIFLLNLLCASCESDMAARAPSSTAQGKGGSLARFALGENHLYAVDNFAINVFEILANGALKNVNRVDVGFGIETIFVMNDNLFLGANDALYIYDIEDSNNPKFLSRYNHIISCDPVVVNGSVAYVTLRIGGCRQTGSDALEIINVSDLNNPLLIKSYEVKTPYGLGIDGNTLFLCQGSNGMDIFNVTDPQQISVIKSYTNIHAYDVIPNNGVLIVTGDSGVFQYDYQDLNDIQLLSHIAVQ